MWKSKILDMVCSVSFENVSEHNIDEWLQSDVRRQFQSYGTSIDILHI